MKLGVTAKGTGAQKSIVIAGSINGRDEAEKSYQILTSITNGCGESRQSFISAYLQTTPALNCPMPRLQKAYDWSRVSLFKEWFRIRRWAIGLIAGYRTSGESQRPGFAWFFGRDSLWIRSRS